MQENPYKLADDIWGIGFKTADTIAAKMGFGHEKYERLLLEVNEALLADVLDKMIASEGVEGSQRPPNKCGVQNDSMLSNTNRRRQMSLILFIDSRIDG